MQTFMWSILDITLWGFVSMYVSRITESNFFLILLGGIVLWEFLNRIMNNIAVAFFEDVWSRNFLNVFASPLTMVEYILGIITASIGMTVFGYSVILIFTMLAFGFSVAVYGLMLVPFIFVLFLSGVALGIVGIALVLRYGPSIEWFIWPLPAVVVPFVGVFYPINTLPLWMQYVSQILPPTYVFEGMRSIAAGETFPVSSLTVSIALGCLSIALAYAFFVSVYRRAIRTGLIARYSAETVS